MKRVESMFALGLLLLLGAGCRSGINLSTAEGQMRFGVRAARMDLWREAQFRFRRATEIDPNNAQALNNLAVAYEGIGDFENAKKAYLQALRIDRSNEYVQRNYSRFVEFYSRYDESKEEEKKSRDEKAGAAVDEPAVPDDTSTDEPPGNPEPPETPSPPPPAGLADAVIAAGGNR